MFFKPTDAPHYLRIVKQRQRQSQSRKDGVSCQSQMPAAGHHPGNSITRGCLAGTGFCFISHRGRVQGCGILM